MRPSQGFWGTQAILGAGNIANQDFVFGEQGHFFEGNKGTPLGGPLEWEQPCCHHTDPWGYRTACDCKLSSHYFLARASISGPYKLSPTSMPPTHPPAPHGLSCALFDMNKDRTGLLRILVVYSCDSLVENTQRMHRTAVCVWPCTSHGDEALPGGGYQFPCSPEINGLCPLFPKTKILIFYVPCSPKLPLFPCSPHFWTFVPLKNMPSFPCSPKPLGGPRWFRTDVPRTMGPYGPPSPPQVLWLWNHADRSIMRENAYLSQF